MNDEALVRTRLSSLLNAVMILDTAGVSCANALLSPTNDYEDAVQIETAISFGVDYIVAHDQFGFTKSPIPVRTAKEILSEMA